MLDGVEPATIDEVHRTAAHVEGIEKVVKVRGRWIGHRLHLDVEIAVSDGLLLGTANSIADELRHELADHIAGLEATTVSFVSVGEGEGRGHHHAPNPFRVNGTLANGLLEIVDTPDGERMRLRVSKHAEGLSAEVVIDRTSGAQEILQLAPLPLDHHVLESTAAPAEPHEFAARLRLSSGTALEELAFTMAEPASHQH